MSTMQPKLPHPRVVATALTLALATAAGSARADASAADKAAARELGIAGIQLADKGDCAAAVVKLQKAAQLYAAPTIVERLGECQIALGKIVAGTENLENAVHSDLGSPPNPVFVEAQKRARKALDAARPRIAKVVIHLVGPKPDDARVTVDGERVAAALIDAERPTDPGAHQLAASAPGYKDATSSLTLADGARAEVTLTLEPQGAAPAPAPAPAPLPANPPPVTPAPAPAPSPTPAPEPETPASHGGSIVPALGAFVVGAAGIAVGGVFGVMAMNKKSSLDNGACDSSHACLPGSQPDIDTMNQNALVSTIGFIAGGVGVAGGIVLLLTRSSGSEPAPHASEPPKAGLTPLLGPGSVGLRGSF